MTAGDAIKMADELRPNNHFENRLKQLWLRQADSGMRRNIVERPAAGLLCGRSTLSALAGCADGPCTGRDGPGSE